MSDIAGPSTVGRSAGKDLLAVIGDLLDAWPGSYGNVVARLQSMPTLINGTARASYLESLANDIYVLSQAQRLFVSQSAATAAEHAVAWRLGINLINGAARVRLTQLSDLLRIEREHEEARFALLGLSQPAGPAIDPAIRLAADAWTIQFAGLAGSDDPLQSAEAAAFLTANEAERRPVLNRWVLLLSQQRAQIAEWAQRQSELLSELLAEQKQQLPVAREAIRRSDEYWTNVALTLAIFGVIVGAVAVWSTSPHEVFINGEASGARVLTGAVWALVTLILIIGGSCAFVFRSATMAVIRNSEGRRRYTRAAIFYVAFLLISICLYLSSAGILFFHISSWPLAGIFGPLLVGLSLVGAAVLLFARGPRRLQLAVDEITDGAADVDLPDAGGLAYGRFNSSFQQLSGISERRREISTRQSRYWNRVALWLGIPATVLTGLGAATGFTSLTNSGPGKYVLAAFTLVGASLTGLATSLQASGKAETAAVKAASYEALGREIKVARRVDLPRWERPDKRRALEDFLNRINVLSGVTDQASFFSRTHPLKGDDPQVGTGQQAAPGAGGGTTGTGGPADADAGAPGAGRQVGAGDTR